MIKLKDILQEKTYKTTISTSSNWIVYNMSDALKIKPIKVVKSEKEALKLKKSYQQRDKLGAYGAVTVKEWNKSPNTGKKLKEAKGPKIKPGDIKKGMMVWFSTDGKGAKRLKVRHLVPALGKHEYHYITNKGTFTPDDVVGY